MLKPSYFENASTEKKQRNRLFVVLIVFSIIFTLLGLRAFQLQIVEKEKWVSMIQKSQFQTFKFSSIRGNIVDRNRKPLAISVKVFSLAINPRLLFQQNKKKIALQLSKILDINKEKLLQKLFQDRYFIRIKRHLTTREKQQVEVLSETFADFKKAMKFYSDRKRFYPNKTLASHVIGYTDTDGTGLSGVERYLNSLLQGKDIYRKFAFDNKGRRFIQAGWHEDERQWGLSAVLTIDKSIQFITQKALDKAVKEHKAKRGVAIVMSPETGEVLAMANSPGFDLNHFRDFSLPTRNSWAISSPYEPGSTMKPISLAIARHLGKLRWNERINCENGRMKIGRYTIRDDHPQKILTPLQVIKYSSNICTSKIAMRLPKTTFHQFLKKFGFGEKTNFGLPWESKGILHPPKKWANISFANISFGQGIAVTPLQLTVAINAIVAGGIYRKPRLYKQLLNWKQETVFTFPKEKGVQIVSPQASKAILKMMESVVEKGGTGPKAAIEGILVGGKTGTAQKSRENGRGYGKKRIASFVGFLPAENPKLTILVVLDEPVTSNYGGIVAAPCWKEIAKASLHYVSYYKKGDLLVAKKEKLQPKKEKIKSDPTAKTKKLPLLVGKNIVVARKMLEALGLELVVIGKGTIRFQSPPANTFVKAKKKIVAIASQ